MSDMKPKFNPNQPFQVAKPKFDPSQPFQSAGGDEPEVQEDIPLLPAIVDKFAQGGSGGFADEFSGALEAAGQAAGVEGLGKRLKDIKISDHGPTTDWEVLKHAYLDARNKDRQIQKQESEDHPILSGASEIAGAVMSPINKLIPVGSSGAKAGAIIGGVQGLGNSDSDSVGGMALDTATGVGLGAGTGYVADKVMQGIPKLFNRGVESIKEKAAQKLGQNLEYTKIPNADEVEQAARSLGLENVPKAVLTDNPTYQKLESGLAQSGSFPATSVRQQYNDFFKGLDDAGSKIADLRSPESSFALGQNIQKSLGNEVENLRKPVSELYNDLTPHFQKIPVDQRSVKSTFGALKRNPIFQTADGRAMLEEYQNIALQQPELNSLKELRSSIGDAVGAQDAPIMKNRIDAIYDALTSVRDKSIQAMKTDLPKELHGEVDALAHQVALADSAHASTLSDLNSIKGLVGNRDFKSPITFQDKLAAMDGESLADRAANLDISQLQAMKDKFPSIFEKAKQAKLNEMIANASKNPVKGFDENVFFKQFQAMPKELRDLVLDPKAQDQITNLITLKSAIPPKLGPSGTPEGQMMMQMFSPKRNAMDYMLKKVLEKSTNEIPASIEPAIEHSVSPKTVNSVLQFVPRSIQSDGASVFPRAAEGQDDSASNFDQSMGKDALLAKTQGSKYGQVLQNAAAKGDQSLAAAHYVLSQRDPSYRKITEGH